METELKLCKCLTHKHKQFFLVAWTTPDLMFSFPLSLSGDPHNDPNAQGDAFKTLFVARVVSTLVSHIWNALFIGCALLVFNSIVSLQNYDTTESKLRREFEVYGPIKRVCFTSLLFPFKTLAYDIWQRSTYV